jgi:hypothetical protein
MSADPLPISVLTHRWQVSLRRSKRSLQSTAINVSCAAHDYLVEVAHFVLRALSSWILVMPLVIVACLPLSLVSLTLHEVLITVMV